MNWFGTDWGAPVCEPERHVPTPVGKPCFECEQPIRETDAGFTMKVHGRDPMWHEHDIIHYHRVCFLRTVIPCESWTGELVEDLPERWRTHRAEAHPDLIP